MAAVFEKWRPRLRIVCDPMPFVPSVLSPFFLLHPKHIHTSLAEDITELASLALI